MSFDLRAGEILGFFGLVGAGRSEVAEMIFGVTRPARGEIRVGGKAVRIRSPRQAMRLGISFLPEDRHQQGLVLQFPIRANETLPVLRRLSGALGLVHRAREAEVARDFAARMRVVATGIEQLTSTLSGGNQQKVLLAKWLIPSPKILILDQPTRGIDVGAKAEIHRIVSHLATQGIAIILIGDDAEEVMAMADRIIVFRGGRVAAEIGSRRVRSRGDPSRRRPRIARSRRIRPLARRMTPAYDTAAMVAPRKSRGFVGRLLRARELRLVVALLVIGAAVTAREPRFLSGANLEQVALSATLVCIVAIGQALVIIARQIDLSVGAIVAMSAFVSADWLAAQSRRLAGHRVPHRLRGRACARHRQCPARRRLPHSGDRRHARHAGDLSRRRDRLCRRPADLGDRAAGQLWARRAAGFCGRAAPRLACRAPHRRVRAGGAVHAHRAQSLCARQQPRGRAHRRHRRALARRSRLHAVGLPVRAGRRALGRPLRHGRRDHRAAT